MRREQKRARRQNPGRGSFARSYRGAARELEVSAGGNASCLRPRVSVQRPASKVAGSRRSIRWRCRARMQSSSPLLHRPRFGSGPGRLLTSERGAFAENAWVTEREQCQPRVRTDVPRVRPLVVQGHSGICSAQRYISTSAPDLLPFLPTNSKQPLRMAKISAERTGRRSSAYTTARNPPIH